MIRDYLIVIGLFLAMVGSAKAAEDAKFEVVPIATQLQTVPGSDDAPAILKDGSVLYVVEHKLMQGDGRQSKMLYEATDTSEITPYSTRSVSFNSQGDFVARCSASSRQAVIVRSYQGETEVVDRRPASLLGHAAINDNGTVAYTVRVGDTVKQVMLYDGQTKQAIATGDTLDAFVYDLPSLNNEGKVAIGSISDVFLIDYRSETPKVDSLLEGEDLRSIDGISLADDDKVAFRVKRPLAAIYVHESGKLTKIADSSATYASFGKPAINNRGQIAFHAVYDDGSEGVLLYSDGKLLPMIMSGDQIGDSEITTIRFGSSGLNDDGQIAVWALFLDGNEGVYRVSEVTE